MYIYNIGYDTYEESEHIQLYHKNKFSDKEFKEMIKIAIVNILDKTENKERENLNFEDILEVLTKELIKDFGFKEIKFDANFSVFGWASILDKKDWKEVRGQELNEISDFVNCRIKK